MRFHDETTLGENRELKVLPVLRRNPVQLEVVDFMTAPQSPWQNGFAERSGLGCLGRGQRAFLALRLEREL